MKIGKSRETYKLKMSKQKHQQLILIAKKLECKTMKTCIYMKVAKQIEEQEMLGLKTFFNCEQKRFVDLGLTGSVSAANYSFVLLVIKTHLFKKLAE